MIEGRWIIPACWVWVCAGEIADVISGGTPSTSDPSNFTKDGFPWLTPADLSNYKSTYIERGARDISEKGLKTSSARILPKGAVLFTSRAPIGYCAIAANEISTNQGFKSLVLYGDILPEFVRHYLLSAKAYAESLASGSTFKELSGKRVENLEIPLPPLNEQRRIVAKIETLKARSQQVKEALEAIPPLLEQFRQSVLAAAFRGDLTADWREKNPDVEPASVLLERIREKRQYSYEEQCRKAEKEGRKKPKNQNNNKKSTHPAIEINNIPDSWAVARLEDISYLVTDGTHQTPKYKTEGVPFLSVKNVRPFIVKDEDVKFISQEEYQEINVRCNPEKGDILYTKVGATFGYAAINRLDYPFSIFVSLALIKPVHPCFSSEYAEVVMNSEIVFSQARQRVTGIGTPDLHLIEIRDFRIPLPPLEEQQEIVNRVYTFLKVVNHIEQQYQEAKAYLEQLDQSILAKAFRGELVPQDPNDEPASILLERIQAERANREAEAKAAKKSTGKTNGRRSRKAQQQDSESIQLDLPGVE